MDTVAAVEDAFLRGEWTQALTESRETLAHRIVQLRQKQEAPQTSDEQAEAALAAITPEEERVLSVYLQSVFELELYDEVETAAAIARAFAPLPFGVAIQWSKFLMAMRRRPLAVEVLRELLASYPSTDGHAFSSKQYAKAMEVLALQLLLPDEGIDAARECVKSDGVLGDPSKLQLLRRIQAAYMDIQAASKQAEQVPTPAQAPRTAGGSAPESNQYFRDAPYSHSTPNEANATRYKPVEPQDGACSYAMIGGTAVALAVAAAGALRYREKIHESVASMLPAISKSLADAKYALFDA